VGLFERCADQLDDFVATLEEYPQTVLAFALRAHLCGLLQALRAEGLWSAADLATFLAEMVSEAAPDNPASG